MRLTKKEADQVIDILFDEYKDRKTELVHRNPFELLIATILSAQTTDVRVNIVTKELFRRYPNPQSMSKADTKDIEDLIKTVGLYRTKAKNIKNSSKILVIEYNGEVPKTRKELMKLPGVGRKTANVVMSNAFNIPAIAVDTHVQRVSNRIGLAESKDVLRTEKQLEEIIDKEKWNQAHHALILHGRRVCKARNPLCEECKLNSICLFYKEK